MDPSSSLTAVVSRVDCPRAESLWSSIAPRSVFFGFGARRGGWVFVGADDAEAPLAARSLSVEAWSALRRFWALAQERMLVPPPLEESVKALLALSDNAWMDDRAWPAIAHTQVMGLETPHLLGRTTSAAAAWDVASRLAERARLGAPVPAAFAVWALSRSAIEQAPVTEIDFRPEPIESPGGAEAVFIRQRGQGSIDQIVERGFRDGAPGGTPVLYQFRLRSQELTALMKLLLREGWDASRFSTGLPALARAAAERARYG